MKRKKITGSLRWNGVVPKGCVLAVAVLLAGPGITAVADQWPQFRGIRADGVAESSHPVQWNETQNVAWMIRLKGEGWSCPIVWENQKRDVLSSLILSFVIPSIAERSLNGNEL